MSIDEYIDKFLCMLLESFHTIVDATRKIKVSALIQGRVKQQVAQASGSKALSTENFDLPFLSATATGSRKLNKFTKKTKKNKFWNRFKSGLRMGSSSNSGSNSSECVRYGKSHKRPYRFGTTACYKYIQKGHMASEYPNVAKMTQCNR